METYKIVEKVSDNTYKFLFHDRKRLLKDGDTIQAVKKMGYEAYDKNGNKRLYLTGIHVIETLPLCQKYLRRFKDQTNKTIVVCSVVGDYRLKPKGNPGVLLADEVTILREV
jgi:hypothetical protein